MRSAPPPPTVDVQDFSVPVLEVVPADEGHDNTQQQQRQQQQQQQQPERPTELETNTSLDLEVEPQVCEVPYNITNFMNLPTGRKAPS